MDNPQAGRLYNQHLIANHVCAICFGPLVEKHIEGADRVVCPRDCKPGGFVTQAYADKRKAESAAELEEVSKNYPQWDSRPPLSPEQRQAALSALYGREE